MRKKQGLFQQRSCFFCWHGTCINQSSKKPDGGRIMGEDQKRWLQVLGEQVRPALGCTEPAAVAMAVARARENLPESVRRLKVTVDRNMFKNALNVGIPGTEERGLHFASALALVSGHSSFGLEVFKNLTNKEIDQAIQIMAQKMITIELDRQAKGLTIQVEAWGDQHHSQVHVTGSHTNIDYETLDGVFLGTTNPRDNQSIEEKTIRENPLKAFVKQQTIGAIVESVEKFPIEDITFLMEGAEMNLRIAQQGIEHGLGVGLGRMLMSKAISVQDQAKAMTAAASEARMAGSPLPVMSSAGSGNHGLTAIIPIAVVGKAYKNHPERILRALALSHMVTIYIKAFLGPLNPICGCGVAAGVGCTSGLVYLQDGSPRQISHAIDNMVAGLTGMICDGAKIGCASKLALAVEGAVDAADMALAGINIPNDNGILGRNSDETIHNLAQLSLEGMREADQTILEVMLHRC